jgi:hypothetical protein
MDDIYDLNFQFNDRFYEIRIHCNVIHDSPTCPAAPKLVYVIGTKNNIYIIELTRESNELNYI